MSKFKCFSQDSYAFAEQNIKTLDENIKQYPLDNSWINAYFKDHSLSSTSYQFDFELKYDFSNPDSVDLKNAITMYEEFNKAGLSRVVIFNPNFMCAFAIQNGYKYYSSHFNHPQSNIKSTKGTLIFEGGSRRAIARNIVGRLYLLVQLTIDNSNEDKYAYTKYVMSHPALRRIVFYTYMDNDIARLSLIKAVKEYEETNNKQLTITKMNKVLTHLSCLSNVNIVPAMEEHEVRNFLLDYLEEIND